MGMITRTFTATEVKGTQITIVNGTIKRRDFSENLAGEFTAESVLPVLAGKYPNTIYENLTVKVDSRKFGMSEDTFLANALEILPKVKGE